MRKEIEIDGLPTKRRDAVEQGISHYHTGKPCVNGHTAPRVAKWGHCVECCRDRWSDENNEKLYYYTREMYKNHPHKRLVNAAKVRAKRSGQEFTITYDDVTIPETCPILGIPLNSHTNTRQQDDSASIDRINSTKGYTPDNIVVVSWRANRLKSDATLPELKALVNFLENGT